MRKKWTIFELLVLRGWARPVANGDVTYYRACKVLTAGLGRSWESVRSRLKRMVKGYT